VQLPSCPYLPQSGCGGQVVPASSKLTITSMASLDDRLFAVNGFLYFSNGDRIYRFKP